eukprot:14034112-Alexandrium_andersonii.AAC.1
MSQAPPQPARSAHRTAPDARELGTRVPAGRSPGAAKAAACKSWRRAAPCPGPCPSNCGQKPAARAPRLPWKIE